MPGPDGKWTEDESNRALTWIRQKWPGSKRCPICDHDEFIFQDCPGRLSAGSVSPLPKRVFIFVVVGCANCGYTMTFNAVAMGIVPASSTPRSVGPEKGAQSDE
jgi:hypothetical protein